MPGFAHALGAAAEHADVAGHGLQGGRHAVVLFAVGCPAGRPGGLQRCGLGLGVQVGQLADVRGLDATDRLGPLGRLGRLVVGAQDVVLEVLLVGVFLGQGALVHAEAELVDELLVLQVVGEDVVRHRGHHGRVGVGLDRNPPGVVAGGRVGVCGIDQHELAAALLGHAHVVEGVAAVEGVGGVPAPHDDQLAVGEGVVLVAVLDGAEGHAAGERGGLVARHRPRIGAAPEHAQEAAKQALDLVGLVQHAVRGAGVALVEQGGRAVLLLEFDHLLRDGVQGLVPGHALEFAFTTFADAHHRVQQPLGRIQACAVGASAQAGAQLRFLEGVLAIGAAGLVFPVVGGQANDHVALLVGHQHMARTAVVGA
ncbi:MAG: hypothetical protein BWX79_02625 [Alphaproteobacteria bacterium ADurb.Bin100]|nr:MAG: hypothetical protein BWX79_02625 [Alphaproteobacteria bacterium ADurb.Bin100]